MWGLWWESSACRVAAGTPELFDEQDRVAALGRPAGGRHRVRGVVGRRRSRRRGSSCPRAALAKRSIAAASEYGSAAGDRGRPAARTASGRRRRGSPVRRRPRRSRSARAALSASAVADGSDELPDSRIGARIGAAISTDEAIAACQSSVGASVTTGGWVPAPRRDTPRAPRRPRRRPGRRRRRGSCSWSRPSGIRASGRPRASEAAMPGSGPRDQLVAASTAGEAATASARSAAARASLIGMVAPDVTRRRARADEGDSGPSAAGARCRSPRTGVDTDQPRCDTMYIAATPNPRTTKSAERGTQVPGANPAVNPREAQALLAPARQLTPQADEREHLRVRHLIAPEPCRCWRWRSASSALAGGQAAAASGSRAAPRRARAVRAWRRRPGPRQHRRAPDRAGLHRRRSSTASRTRRRTRRSRSSRRSGPATGSGQALHAGAAATAA